MNESVELVGGPELIRNSLIRIGRTFLTFSDVATNCLRPFVAFVHEARPTRSPLTADVPEVILKVALTLAPGAIGPADAIELLVVREAMEVHCLLGGQMLSVTSDAGAPVVLAKVNVVSCEDPGEKVCRFDGATAANAGARLK